jgi:hypothetical protein
MMFYVNIPACGNVLVAVDGLGGRSVVVHLLAHGMIALTDVLVSAFALELIGHALTLSSHPAINHGAIIDCPSGTGKKAVPKGRSEHSPGFQPWGGEAARANLPYRRQVPASPPAS